MRNIDRIWENMEEGDKHIIGIIMNRVVEIGDIALTKKGDINREILTMKGTDRRIEVTEGKKETVQGGMNIALVDIVMKDLEGMIGRDIGKDKRMEREDKGEVLFKVDIHHII